MKKIDKKLDSLVLNKIDYSLYNRKDFIVYNCNEIYLQIDGNRIDEVFEIFTVKINEEIINNEDNKDNSIIYNIGYFKTLKYGKKGICELALSIAHDKMTKVSVEYQFKETYDYQQKSKPMMHILHDVIVKV